jgi:hypothetical protein
MNDRRITAMHYCYTASLVRDNEGTFLDLTLELAGVAATDLDMEKNGQRR